ncbi:MAG: type II toxin-antitoxin system VapC family toxin [Sinobacteraceae bacterium]|nr:type II toxin-antitoxin system VapC family toxin [Nevskiaceae bacterium]
MSAVVYDASALLAVIFDEPGADNTMAYLARPGGEVSAVNWSEVGAKLAERGLPEKEFRRELAAFSLEVVPFDAEQAHAAAALRPLTREFGLSLSDRCCLALAQLHDACVITADGNWRKVPGFDVVAIRNS